MMKNILFAIGIATLGAAAFAQQKTSPAKANGFSKALRQIVDFVATAAAEADVKKSAIATTSTGYGQYAVKGGLPDASHQVLSFYKSSSRWKYQGEFGRFSPAQAAAQKNAESRLGKDLEAAFPALGWSARAAGTADGNRTGVAAYQDASGSHHAVLESVFSKTLNMTALILRID